MAWPLAALSCFSSIKWRICAESLVRFSLDLDELFRCSPSFSSSLSCFTNSSLQIRWYTCRALASLPWRMYKLARLSRVATSRRRCLSALDRGKEKRTNLKTIRTISTCHFECKQASALNQTFPFKHGKKNHSKIDTFPVYLFLLPPVNIDLHWHSMGKGETSLEIVFQPRKKEAKPNHFLSEHQLLTDHGRRLPLAHGALARGEHACREALHFHSNISLSNFPHETGEDWTRKPNWICSIFFVLKNWFFASPVPTEKTTPKTWATSACKWKLHSVLLHPQNLSVLKSNKNLSSKILTAFACGKNVWGSIKLIALLSRFHSKILKIHFNVPVTARTLMLEFPGLKTCFSSLRISVTSATKKWTSFQAKENMFFNLSNVFSNFTWNGLKDPLERAKTSLITSPIPK